MGEIKSTLELIMEKAMGMTISEEERREFRIGEVVERVRPLVVRYLGGVITLERFRREISSVEGETRDMTNSVAVDELMQRITLGGDNGRILEAMEGLDKEGSGMVKEVLPQFESRLKEARIEKEKAMLEGFLKAGISGSAVIPNPDSDPGWRELRSEMRNGFQERVRSRRM